MTISIISIKQSDTSGWNIFHTTLSIFLNHSGGNTQSILCCKSPDEKIAKLCAEKIAAWNKIPFISTSTSVITVTPFCGTYLPVEVTIDGCIIPQGKESTSLEMATLSAQKVATRRFLPFVFPQDF